MMQVPLIQCIFAVLLVCIRTNMYYFRSCCFRPPVKPVACGHFQTYLLNANCSISGAAADGFCYLNSVQKSLALDHDKYMSIEDIQSEILCHLLHHESLYTEYHQGDIAVDAENFFSYGNFVQSIVDVIVYCTPSALKLNQYIYQEDKSNGIIKVTQFKQDDTYPNVHLYFDYNPNYDLGNHYKPIIKTKTIIDSKS